MVNIADNPSLNAGLILLLGIVILFYLYFNLSKGRDHLFHHCSFEGEAEAEEVVQATQSNSSAKHDIHKVARKAFFRAVFSFRCRRRYHHWGVNSGLQNLV